MAWCPAFLRWPGARACLVNDFEWFGAILGRLPGGLLILVDAIRDHRDRFAPAWQRYAEARGMSAEWMAAFIERITASSNTATEARELALLDEAGFRDVTRFFAAFPINGWIATNGSRP